MIQLGNMNVCFTNRLSLGDVKLHSRLSKLMDDCVLSSILTGFSTFCPRILATLLTIRILQFLKN